MEYVTDTKGTRYELEKELGAGGQGLTDGGIFFSSP